MSKTQLAQDRGESAFYVNGAEVQGAPISLESLLARYHIFLASQGVAVAINDRVIPRSVWAESGVLPQDRVEIVRAFQGG